MPCNYSGKMPVLQRIIANLVRTDAAEVFIGYDTLKACILMISDRVLRKRGIILEGWVRCTCFARPL